MDIVVYSHLRWDFVYQRPQHLLTRAARDHRVLFIEEAMEDDDVFPGVRAERREAAPNVEVIVPHLPAGLSADEAERRLGAAITPFVERWVRGPLVLWHYSVMAEPLSRDLDAALTVFDCMDELAAFRGAPPELVEREQALIDRSDLVFTGGYSLYEAKRHRHPGVHAFPSGVDLDHFARARSEQPEPDSMAAIGRPRLVYAGVIDERVDLGLALGRQAQVAPHERHQPFSVFFEVPPRGPLPFSGLCIDPDPFEHGERVERGRSGRSLHSPEVLPQIVVDRLWMRRGNLHDDAAASMICQGCGEVGEVGHVVEDVMAQHDVGDR
jgi:hypothetical protein